MEDLNEKIKEIEVNNIEYDIDWLSKGKNYGINDPANLLRFLLRKVVELEEKIEAFTKQNH